MRMTRAVKNILANYESDSPGIKRNLAAMLMQGKLAGTGKMIILPVDQGFEHGPARSFAINEAAYDPYYHFKLAIDSGCSAYAAPLGQLEMGADHFAGQVPTILKMNSSNSWSTTKDQAVTASIDDALRLGVSAIGFTIYPGSDYCLELMEEIRELAAEAKSVGIAVVIWSYPRGGDLSKDGETALDVTAYGAHLAAQLGAHIIKVKLPTAHIEQKEAKIVYEQFKIKREKLSDRVAHIVQSCFAGRRMVVFSGGAAKSTAEVLSEVQAIRDGGGNGSIMGRNCFQRPRQEALDLLDSCMKIYR